MEKAWLLSTLLKHSRSQLLQNGERWLLQVSSSSSGYTGYGHPGNVLELQTPGAPSHRSLGMRSHLYSRIGKLSLVFPVQLTASLWIWRASLSIHPLRVLGFRTLGMIGKARALNLTLTSHQMLLLSSGKSFKNLGSPPWALVHTYTKRKWH